MIQIIAFTVAIAILIVAIIFAIRTRNTRLLVSSIAAVLLVTIVGVLLYSTKPKETSTEPIEVNTEEPVRQWELSMPIGEVDPDNLMNTISPILMSYTNTHGLPPATHVDKTWNESDGLHIYAQSTFGDQTYEVLITDDTLSLDFYGSAFHKGCKGIAYGTAIMHDVDIPAIEEKLISMGYGNLLFTVKEVTDDKVVLESETGFTQEFDR